MIRLAVGTDVTVVEAKRASGELRREAGGRGINFALLCKVGANVIKLSRSIATCFFC